VDGLGGVPLDRILFRPPPGRATEADVVAVHEREQKLCELVDGTLVEKGMGLPQSIVAAALIQILREFVMPRNLGIVSGESGMMKLFEGLIRIPDVAYASWGRLPGHRVPTEPVPLLVPDLAVEVLSPGNTPREMSRKRREYFEAGVTIVWIVDIDARTVAVYTGPEQSTLSRSVRRSTAARSCPGLPWRFRRCSRNSTASAHEKRATDSHARSWPVSRPSRVAQLKYPILPVTVGS
jgi:Uma2 family endonuclease